MFCKLESNSCLFWSEWISRNHTPYGNLPRSCSKIFIGTRNWRTNRQTDISFSNKFNQSKNRQCVSNDEPYVIAFALGDPRVAQDGIISILNTRIWPNKLYSKISGIIFYNPPTGFQSGDAGHSLWLNINHNASAPAPKSLIEAFEGKRQFHWP